MADPLDIATKAVVGGLVLLGTYREILIPFLRKRERRHGADSERPSHSDVDQAVDHSKLRSDVDSVSKAVEELRGAHERFVHETNARFQLVASADALATTSQTTTATLIQLTDKVAEVRGMVAALQSVGRTRYP